MKKTKKFLNINFKTFITKFLISTLIIFSFFFGLYFGTEQTIKAASDGFFIGSSLMIGVSFIALLNSKGAFDTFGYSFSTLRTSFGFNSTKKYKDLYEYTVIKYEKRSKEKFIALPYFISGVIFLIVSIILMCVFYTKI